MSEPVRRCSRQGCPDAVPIDRRRQGFRTCFLHRPRFFTRSGPGGNVKLRKETPLPSYVLPCIDAYAWASPGRRDGL